MLAWVEKSRFLAGGGLAAVGAFAGRCAALSLRGAVRAFWRPAAALFGLALAGWLADALPALMAGPAEPRDRPAAAAGEAGGRPMVTGALGPARVDPTSAPDWAPIARAQPSFALPAAEGDVQGWRFTAQRDRRSDMREERFLLGEFAADAPFVDIAIVRQAAAREEASLLVETARRSASAGRAVLRGGQPAPLHSKFGLVETADLVLRSGERERACLAFRHFAAAPALRMEGLICGAGARPADRRQLACLLDRIGLVSAGEDRELRAYFSRAELARQPGCTPSKLEAAGRRVSWLDPEASAPRLRR